MKRVAVIFGTRPEIIKLAPVIRALATNHPDIGTVHVHTGQHADLADTMLDELGVRVDHGLSVMRDAPDALHVLTRAAERLAPVLDTVTPDLVLVQGDTASVLAGALAAFHARVPIGHVEAGLRSGDVTSPFPEEMNRRLVTQLTDLHFAATQMNRRALLDEGVDDAAIHVTGNPVVDALLHTLEAHAPTEAVRQILENVRDHRLIVVTTHRRESFGGALSANLEALGRFVASRPDVILVFPVHPNPNVVANAKRLLGDRERIHLVPPLGYGDFLHLLSAAWLVVSDSGGVQEEVPSLGKPLIVLRDTTERREAVDTGFARLTNNDVSTLERFLLDAEAPGGWSAQVAKSENPFGDGHAGTRIAEIAARFLERRADRGAER